MTEQTVSIVAIGITMPGDWDCSKLDKIDISILGIDCKTLKEEINVSLIKRSETEVESKHRGKFNIYAAEMDNVPMSSSIEFTIKNIDRYPSKFCLFIEDDKYDVNFLGYTNTLSISEFSQESIAAFVCLK